MSFPAIAEIKKRRLNLDLSQKELASLCDICQSFLAKIERRQAVPSYTISVRVFEKLADLESKKSKKLGTAYMDILVRDVMSSPVYSFAPTDSAEQILSLMLKQNISQVPILDKDKGLFQVGTITEKTLMGKDVKGKLARDVMDPKNLFPIVAKDAKLSVLVAILQEEQAVLVFEKSKIVGIVTKQDILKVKKSKTVSPHRA
jgi:predicted transcriptional regulator